MRRHKLLHGLVGTTWALRSRPATTAKNRLANGQQGWCHRPVRALPGHREPSGQSVMAFDSDTEGFTLWVSTAQKDADAALLARVVAAMLDRDGLTHWFEFYKTPIAELLTDPDKPSYAKWFRAVRYAALSMAEEGKRPLGPEFQLRAEEFLKGY